MKTKKRRLEYLSFYNHTGIEAHFAKMAKKGWLIESISNFYWTYRKIEPQDIPFCVTYYPRASDFDPEPSEEQQTFHDFCAHTGWKLACTWHQMQVFYNEKESPIPLETDPIMEVDTLHRACRKNFLPSYYAMLALGILMGGYSLARIYFDPIGLLSNSSQLVVSYAYISLLALSFVELITYFTWHKKAKRAALDGIFVDTPNTSKFQMTIMFFLLIVAVFWLINLFAADDPLLVWVAIVMLIGMLTVMLIINGIKQGLKKSKVSRGFNKVLTLTACFILPTIMTGIIIYGGIALIRDGHFDQNSMEEPNVPLSVSDFINVEDVEYIETSRNHQTFLLGQTVTEAFPHWDEENRWNMPDLRYTITTVKVPALYEWCKNQMHRDLDETNNLDVPAGHRLVYVEQDPAPWDANEVYRLYQEEGWYMNWYLLCYEDKIVEIRFDWEPTTDDMAIVSRELNQ